MKRIVKLVISIVLSIGVTVGIVVLEKNINLFTIDEYSETFIGYISETIYDSKENTAKGFLAKELSGVTADLKYKNYRKIADLSSNEIESLGVTKLTDKEIVSAEKVNVGFTYNKIASSMNTYFLGTDTGFMYYVAPQETGEKLTNSYLDSVLKGSKYKNCTSTTTVNLRVISSSITTEATYRQQIFFEEEEAFFNQELPGYDQDFYFTERNGRIVAYLKHPTRDDGKYYTLSEINSSLNGYRYEVYLQKNSGKISLDKFTSMQDIIDLMFMMDLDASYFVKTDRGFSMTEDKYKAVCKQMAGEDFAKEIDDVWTDYHVHFRADYFVSDGRLSASQIVLTMSNGKDVYALTLETQYRDFGTTVVTLPK